MARVENKVPQEASSRKRWIRVASFGAAASIAMALLWAAGWPPGDWVARVAGFFEHGAAESLGQPTQGVSADSKVSSALPFQSADPFVGTDSSISDVPLPLYLVGVTPGRNANEGTARIGTSVDNPQTYAAGALLVNGSTLAEIHSDHVVLKRGDRAARLMLYDRGMSPKAPGKNDELLTIDYETGKTADSQPTREPLTEFLRPNPVFDGDILRGYEVYPGKNRGLFAQLGLQSGDVIVAIDGMAVTDAEQTLQMLRELDTGVVLTVTVERRQQQQMLTLDGGAVVASREQATDRKFKGE
ncbi:PDZ domain-containing protein [Steroidobacter flavus]|uniref:PDZ domain-containing protein n=1 Tax=Steroidobacter flavus TaxID=1842136 RepID=A0ABV8SLH1_9GAMM